MTMLLKTLPRTHKGIDEYNEIPEGFPPQSCKLADSHKGTEQTEWLAVTRPARTLTVAVRRWAGERREQASKERVRGG